MPGPGSTSLGGPIMVGTKLANPPAGTGDIGTVVLQQDVVLTQNGASTVDVTLLLPGGAQIIDIICDTTTAWNSGTSDTLSVGTSSGGTQYASGVDVKTSAGRVRPTFTAAQLTNMLNVGTSTPQATIHVTVTPAGTTANAGSTTVQILYIMTVQSTLGTS